MPGRGSYGPGGRWIHDRAHHIMSKNPSMSKEVAYAVATQQAHKVGKSPKGFRTAEGVRTAMNKMTLPKDMYKKTASDKRQEVALSRLKQLIKEAKAAQIGKRVVKFKSAPVVHRAEKVVGAATAPQRSSPVYQLHVPSGMKAKRRGRVARKVFGGPPMKVVPKTSRRAKALGAALGYKALGAAAGKLRQMADSGAAARAASRAAVEAAPEIAPRAAQEVTKAVNPNKKKLIRALQVAGLAAGGGAVGHQLAHSTGMTRTGPADVIANLVVPSEE